MKKLIKSILILSVALTFSSCVSEDDTAIPALTIPVFEDGFENNTWENWTKYNVTGAQVWVLDTQFGNPGNCARMSGYSGTNNENEDWLISPEVDLTDAASVLFSFQSASSLQNGNPLEVKISTDYSGGNPNDATWTNIPATLDLTSINYVWTNSGIIDISSFAGEKVFVAFKYTSTSSASKTWEVDNIKIHKNN